MSDKPSADGESIPDSVKEPDQEILIPEGSIWRLLSREEVMMEDQRGRTVKLKVKDE